MTGDLQAAGTNFTDATPARPTNLGRQRMVRILIADDHALVRAALKRFLEEEGSFVEVGEAGSGSQTLDRLREGDWQVVVLDINMPDRSGIDVLRYIRAGHPDTRVLVLSGFPERQYAVHALRAGASGYLSKEAPPEELLKAIKNVVDGRRYVSAALAELLAADLSGDSEQPLHAKLSTREFQILRKLAAGVSVSAIGRELSLSVKTVSTYRSRILEKMGFKTNADLTSYALKNGLID
jgi:DNA-binding NarL/FixJ family response regulator